MVTASLHLLSAAGIYAMMSFTVTRRTREIGIRSALGADPRCLLLSIFGRVLGQLAPGPIAGSVLFSMLSVIVGVGPAGVAVLLLAFAGVMVAVGLLADLGPARQSLRILPFEALRAET